MPFLALFTDLEVESSSDERNKIQLFTLTHASTHPSSLPDLEHHLGTVFWLATRVFCLSQEAQKFPFPPSAIFCSFNSLSAEAIFVSLVPLWSLTPQQDELGGCASPPDSVWNLPIRGLEASNCQSHVNYLLTDELTCLTKPFLWSLSRLAEGSWGDMHTHLHTHTHTQTHISSTAKLFL